MTCRVAVAQHSTGAGVTEAAVPDRLRVLLASLDAGGGHAALRDSLARALTLPGATPGRFEVLRWDSGHRLTGRVYRIVVHHIPWLQGVAYRAIESSAVVHVTTRGLPGLLREAAATLQAFRPDVVVTTHFIVELAFARARRRVGVAVRLVSAIPDYGIPARGLVPDAAGGRSDAVIVMDEETYEHVVGRCGLPHDRVHLSGFIPREPFDRVAAVARAQPARRAARAAIFTGLRAERRELATLDPARPVVLFVGGSAWARKTWPVLAGLLASRDGLEQLNVIVVCGRDARFEAFLRARGVARPGSLSSAPSHQRSWPPSWPWPTGPCSGAWRPPPCRSSSTSGVGPCSSTKSSRGRRPPTLRTWSENGLGIYEPRPAAMLEILRQATGLYLAGDRIARLLAGFADRAAVIRLANERRATELGGFLARIAIRPEADVPARRLSSATCLSPTGRASRPCGDAFFEDRTAGGGERLRDGRADADLHAQNRAREGIPRRPPGRPSDAIGPFDCPFSACVASHRHPRPSPRGVEASRPTLGNSGCVSLPDLFGGDSRRRKTEAHRADRRIGDFRVAGTPRRPAGLRGPAGVAMMEAADWCLDDATPVGRLHRSGFRGVLVEGQVSPGRMVVDKIRVQDATQLRVVQHHHVVEALTAQGPDETFDIGILPRGPRGALDLVDPHGSNPAREYCPVHRIAVAQQVSGRGVPRERLDELLGRPLGGGVSVTLT